MPGPATLILLTQSAGPAVLASETWTGTNGSAWPAQWTVTAGPGVAVADIQNNTGRMYSAATSYGLGPRAYLSGMPAAADVDLVVSFTTAATVTGEAGYFRVGVRSDGTFTDFAPSTGYSVEFCTSSDGATLGYFQLKAGLTSLTAASMYAFAASTTYRLRLRVVGDTIQAKWWLASASEPTSWGLTATDSTYPAAGKVALTSEAGFQAITRGVNWDDLTVSEAGPGFASVSWQSEVSPTALQLGWILTSGTSVRAVAATDAAFTTPIYGNTITRPPSGWCTSRVTGLTANTSYYTGVEVDGTIIASGRGQYRTLRTDLAAAKVITSSCYAVPGDQPVLARIKTEAPAFFVQQGDIHYWDAATDAEWRGGFSQALTSVGLAATLASVPMPYFWNNHDFADTDAASKDSPAATYAPAALRELSGASVYPDPKGLWRTWVHAGVRYINLDPYTYRNAYTDTDSPTKTMLGATQKAWLLNLLQTSTEQAIIVFSGFAHPSIPAGTGRWANYPDERTEIGTAIAAIPTTQRNKIVFVGGDTHSICADDGTNAMWGRPSLNVSPMQGTGNASTTGTWNITNQAADSARGYFSRLTFTPSGSDLAMTWDAVRDDGVVMATWSTSFPSASIPSGTGSGSWSFTGTGSGKRTPKGTGAGSFTFTGSGSGKRTPKATGTGAWSFTGSGAGTSTHRGTGTGSWTVTGAGTGTTARRGAGSGSFTFAGSGSGKRVAKATGTGSWSFVGAGTGATVRRGTGSGTATWTGAGSGVAPLVGVNDGSGTGSWGFVGTGSGRRSPVGTGSGLAVWTGTGAGVKPVVGGKTGTGSGTWTVAGTGSGTRQPKATGGGTWTYAGTGVGVTPPEPGAARDITLSIGPGRSRTLTATAAASRELAVVGRSRTLTVNPRE